MEFVQHPLPLPDPHTCCHDVGDRFVDVEGAWIVTAPRQQVTNRMQPDLSGKCWLLDDEVPRRANERRGRCVQLGGAVERDVEILRGLGSGNPLALRAQRFDQVLETNPDESQKQRSQSGPGCPIVRLCTSAVIDACRDPAYGLTVKGTLDSLARHSPLGS